MKSEIRKKLLELEVAFRELTEKHLFKMNYNAIGIHLEFNGVLSLYEYINQQYTAWEKETENFQHIQGSVSFFKAATTHIENQVDNMLRQPNNTQNVLNDVQTQLNRTYTSHHPLPINHIFSIGLTIIGKKFNTNVYNGAWYYVQRANLDTNNPDNFKGMSLAFMLEQGVNIDVVDKVNDDLNELEKTRCEYINRSEKAINVAINEYYSKFKEGAESLDNFRKEKTEEFVGWKDGSSNEWNEFYLRAKGEMERLEETYKKALQLEAPADYWDQRGKELNKQGWRAFWGVVGLVSLIVSGLIYILIKGPDDIYSSFIGEDKSAAIRWSLILITAISFMAFGLRATMKVMFSLFHLARDCEERKSLTYFYLSLTKDKEMDKEDRKLVMQSLFSRAETGLLKDDGSPTMPTDKVISRI